MKYDVNMRETVMKLNILCLSVKKGLNYISSRGYKLITKAQFIEKVKS